MTRIKICGLKTLADVTAVNRYLPEYVGFVFAPTKRFVTDEQALVMKQSLNTDIRTVGVFVNEPIAHVISLCEQGIIDIVQLHGDETEDCIREIKRKTDADVIKAVKVQSREQVAEKLSQEADYMLFDTYKKGTLGGTGERFSSDILEAGLKCGIAQGKALKPYFIAGGLSTDTVSEVLGWQTDDIPRCYGVDVSTGVETDGVKDEAKIKEFIKLVRGV